MKCPKCENGKMSVKMIENGVTTESFIKCVFCDGTGDLSKEEIQDIKDEEDEWCTCGNPSDGVDFYDDGQHPNLHKHHYRCKDCNKIVQIG